MSMLRLSTILATFAVLAIVSPFEVAGAETSPAIVYGRDIRPLLSDRCFTCHGPDRNGQENDLRLDHRDAAVAGAIVPGEPANSELLARVLSDDESLSMPPPDSGKKPLTREEVERLRRWIEQGATYTEHWAYVPPTRPEVPAVANRQTVANPIDAFIAAAREEQGLPAAPPADRRTLIRRLSFDLLGLPPTWEQTEAFLNDDSDQAYENLVTQILSSEHFGERMAMYWLDLVRYADTAGYHSDNAREVDAFRDYVIDSFNTNKPFDEFTIEQLAGDLLPEASIQQKVASGYNRLLQTTEEGGAQAKEYIAIYSADRVRNVSDVWLATTLGCAQCHDHKYDPFSTRDFYSMAAFFADVKEVPVGRQQPNLKLPSPEQSSRIAALQQQIQEARAVPVEAEALDDWIAEMRTQLAESRSQWTVVRPNDVRSTAGQTLTVQGDGSVLASGKNPTSDDYTIVLPTGTGSITGLRLEALTDPSLVNKGLSRANGNFVLTGVEITQGQANTPVAVATATASYEQPSWPVAGVLDADPKSGWAVNGHQDPKNQAAVFRFAEPIDGAAAGSLTITLRHQSAHARHNIGRFRISLTEQATPEVILAEEFPLDLAELLTTDDATSEDGAAAAERRTKLEAKYRELSAGHAPVRKRIADAEQELQRIEQSIRKTLVAESTSPRMVRVLPRGNWLDDSGDVVTPNTPAFLGGLDGGENRRTRLDLARWIVDRNNPLTARVFVNRLWKLMFGHGIARSLEDVGHQGAWPTHPELLDWLAVEFMDSGWDVKHMVRLMVLSRTYQQSSAVATEVRERDPFNNAFARQSRFRLDAEIVRDNALAVSGLLVRDIGGRSTKPYQPAGYWAHLNFPVRQWQSDSGADQYRRGLYTFWCRSFLHPSLSAFDAPSREECVANRPRSNTPLQALVLLNDPTYVEAARVLAADIASQPGTDEQRLNELMQTVLQRQPTREEQSVLTEVLTQQRARYQKDADAAGSLLTVGLAPSAEEIAAPDVAAWTAVCRILLNLHETITRS